MILIIFDATWQNGPIRNGHVGYALHRLLVYLFTIILSTCLHLVVVVIIVVTQ